jgi:2-C-methyl-D-erythritol 2,4-cyclodiphosphate synthase
MIAKYYDCYEYNTVVTNTIAGVRAAQSAVEKLSGREQMRIGIGYDVHQLAADRELVLGGVVIDHTAGLLGHSDADVLLHSIMDALLGAAGMGDIGGHFPDTDSKYKGISSVTLLERVRELLIQKGYVVNNVDATIVAQEPRLAPYIPRMVKNIAAALHVSGDRVNVKATTTERLGFTGARQGMAAYAVASVVAGNQYF